MKAIEGQISGCLDHLLDMTGIPEVSEAEQTSRITAE